MRRPRLFFDTNVPQTLAAPSRRAILPRLRKHLAQNYVVMVSPLTVDELLLGILGGDESFFARDQYKMKLLRGEGQLRVLSSPARFAIKQVLGLDTNPPTPSKSEISKIIDTVLRAKTKAQLEQGLVPQPYSKRTCGVNFEPIEERHKRGKAMHARMLESLRLGKVGRPTPLEWVKASFRDLKLNVSDADWKKLATALEAAIALNSYLCDQAAEDGYDFARHDSDWIDVHQLFYLSDPNLHFLTRDTKLRNRISSCAQAERIILLDEVLRPVSV